MPCYRISITRPDVKNPAPYITHANDKDAACARLGAHDKKSGTILAKWSTILTITNIEEI